MSISARKSDSSSPRPALRTGSDELIDTEHWWRDHQSWLAQRGYMLRPRYRPGWKPSWKAHPKSIPMEFEDWYPADRSFILDAVRVSDNSLVVLKQVKKSWNPHEVETLQYLLSDALRSDGRNHTAPLLDVLDVPDDSDIAVLVMPLLRPCDDPPWETVGEVISFLLQVFEGLQFMHELHIAHRDCQAPNILYDPRPMYPNMFHPQAQDRARDWKGAAKHYTRTARPVRYHFIDFGLSRRYNPEDVPPREHPILGGDKTVPEFQIYDGEPIDPFPTDIYYIGNMIRTNVLRKYRGVEFLSLLVQDMVQDDPTKRPTIQEVTQRFDALVKSLGRWKVRSRLIPRDESSLEGVFRDILHTFRTARYIFARKSAIPLPD
ncbi:hypothetical protein BV20DRAFT_1070510 [Pilatotrama ljubarskyi]|nr:hypothetical protein BV20DRAFT_1070510 [Pilatotrama ljubarskyi]